MSTDVSKSTIGLFMYPWQSEYVKSGDSNRTIMQLYKKMIWYKANPRSKEYMEKLFGERYPNGKFICIKNCKKLESLHSQVKACDRVVLLFPDAIGLGFSRVEKLLKNVASPHSSIRILNGRRRDFNYSSSVAISLKFRRFMSKALVCEFMIMPLMLITSLFLVPIDLLRGKK